MRQKKEMLFQQAHPGLDEVPAKRQSWEQISGLKSRKMNCKEKLINLQLTNLQLINLHYLTNAHGGK